MESLNPAETFTINRILKDPFDSTTYYVQAKVYDSQSRTLLKTVPLTDHGDRWFSADYKIPYDNVFGSGKRILITTDVYTDSGYTTRSENHYQEVEEYLIQLRWNPSVNFGGGDGGYDHKAIVKEVTLAVAELLGERDKLKANDVPEDSVDIVMLIDIATGIILKGIDGIGKKIDALPKPKDPQPVNLLPLQELLARISAQIQNLPKPKDPDYAPLLIEFARNLMLVKNAIVDEIAKQGSKELTVLLADSPDEAMRKKKRNMLEGLAKKHGIKLS